MANQYSLEQWQAWFVEFKQSELTVERFCRSIGVSVQSFYKWRRKLRDELATDSRASVNPFVTVRVATSELVVELPGGAIVRVANDKDSLRPLIELLLEIGAKP